MTTQDHAPSRTRRPASRPPARKPARKRRRKAYHHGDLAEALVVAAERVLCRVGVEHLSLRGVAREAGVSHTAPQHHFGDLTGLLSELAALGFDRFRKTMLAAAESVSEPTDVSAALGRGYLRFARENRELFLLMFRSERLDMTRPSLRENANAAFAVLARDRGVDPANAVLALPLPLAARITAAWSCVHGLALLSIDGRLEPLVAAMQGNADEDALIQATLGLFRPPSRG
jgi:AcrR family transcriptional regulator